MEQKHTLFAVVGPKPDDEQSRTLVGVCTEEEEAESLLASGVLTLASEYAKRLKPGGSVSIIIRRGSGPRVDRTFGFGSFVMDNPNGGDEYKARSWDFAVLFGTVSEERDKGDA